MLLFECGRGVAERGFVLVTTVDDLRSTHQKEGSFAYLGIDISTIPSQRNLAAILQDGLRDPGC